MSHFCGPVQESVRRYAAYSDEDVRAYIGWLLSQARLVDDLPDRRIVPDDPNDDTIIATAVVAGADYLVTGDRDLLVLDHYQGVAILTPRQFLDMIAV